MAEAETLKLFISTPLTTSMAPFVPMALASRKRDIVVRMSWSKTGRFSMALGVHAGRVEIGGGVWLDFRGRVADRHFLADRGQGQGHTQRGGRPGTHRNADGRRTESFKGDAHVVSARCHAVEAKHTGSVCGCGIDRRARGGKELDVGRGQHGTGRVDYGPGDGLSALGLGRVCAARYCNREQN